MDKQILFSGDEVLINIPDEFDDEYHPQIQKGTRGIVISFEKNCLGRNAGLQLNGLAPGIHFSKSYAYVQINGRKEGYIINCDYLSLIDKKEQKYRLRRLGNNRKKCQDYDVHYLVKTLPDTPFWEDDLVSYLDELEDDVKVYKVHAIEYGIYERNPKEGPVYKIRNVVPKGIDCVAYEDQLTLLDRGSIWRYYHNETLIFDTVEEEIGFHETIGNVKVVVNPRNGLYVWRQNEIMPAIKNGLADSFEINGKKIILKKFKDRDVSEKAKLLTLKTWGGFLK